MKISRIRIKNFRNLKDIDISLDQHTVIVGENGSGKSNLIFALRILLDPYLPEPRRSLLAEDFWEGITKPYSGDEIVIEAEFKEFKDNEALKSCFSDAIIDPSAKEPIARIGYVFRKKKKVEKEEVDSSKKGYEYVFYQKDPSGNCMENPFRRYIQLFVLKALRDAEKDLRSRDESPLTPFINRLYGEIDPTKLEELAKTVHTSSSTISEIPEIKILSEQFHTRLGSMIGKNYNINPNFGVASIDPRRVLGSLKLYLNDTKTYSVDKSSLGYSNLIYLMLHILNMEVKEKEDNLAAGILGIEEPEAHIHPQMQRLVFKEIFKRKSPTVVTTHSPNIVSVAPLRSIVLLKNKGNVCEARSLFGLDLAKIEVADIERYMDVTRGEIYFSRGVILVEGIAEAFIIKKIAELKGINLDEYGISICTVNGIHFEIYTKLVGKNGLDLPYVVLTDGDKGIDETGYERANKLYESIAGKKAFPIFEKGKSTEAYDLLKEKNIFVGEQTLEIDLIESGHVNAIIQTYKQLNPSSNRVTQDKIEELIKGSISKDNTDWILGKINTVGKGRFAQRLVENMAGGTFPKYILEGIDKIVALTKNAK